jgi:transcriptional regulator with XRE-family HTH domain
MHFLGKNIRHLRKRSSQNQDVLASLVNKGQTTIGNWENGVSEPNLSELLLISNYFGISIDSLLKTDLSRAEPDPSPTPYDHQDEITMAQENYEDRLSPILAEIRAIRSEIERLKARQSGGE